MAWVELKRGNTKAAIKLARSGLARARELDDDPLVAGATNDLGSFLSYDEDARDEAQTLFDESLAFYRRIGDEINVTTALNNLAEVDIATGNLARARRRLEEALEIGRRLDADYPASHAAGELGFVALEEGDSEAALLFFRECLEKALDVAGAGEVLYAIEGIAFAVSSSDPSSAARLLGAADAIRVEHELKRDPLEEEVFVRHMRAIRRNLGDHALDDLDEVASSGATALTLEAAAELALDLSDPERSLAPALDKASVSDYRNHHRAPDSSMSES
jgi:tetratricopeptide (TPR) repeat protein